MTLASLQRKFDARDRLIDRENRKDVRLAWMTESLQRRKRLPSLGKLMRDLFADRPKEYAKAKQDFEELRKEFEKS